MEQFSTKTKLILATSGWYEGRRIDASPYVDRLEKKGYTVFPIAKEFFEQFGELILHRPRPVEFRSSSRLGRIFELLKSSLKHPRPQPWFDLRLKQLEQVLEGYGTTEMEVFIEELDMPLCPIAHCSDSMLYAMDV